jgi:hypothetical protein
MYVRTLIPIIVLLVSVPLFPREKTDVLAMKNGDRMTCEVKGLDSSAVRQLRLHPRHTSVQWSKVAHLESNNCLS